MANSGIPARERVPLTPREEVELAWLEAESTGEQFLNPALDRIRELGIASGRHYHQLISSYAGSVSMLTMDLLHQPGADEKKIRQSIVSRDSLIHHYLFDFQTGEVALLEREISVNTVSGHAVTDAMSPPLVGSKSNNYSRIFMGSGAAYNSLILEQADHLDVFSSPEASLQFVRDTESFTLPGAALHTQPDIESMTYSLDENSFNLS